MLSSQADILKQRVLTVNESTFDSLAIDIFHFQASHNPVYRRYIEQLGKKITDITTVTKIPFLPIEFFKSHAIITNQVPSKVVFESSGTTGSQTSRHYVYDPDFYVKVAIQIFEKFYGSLANFQILALLPSYLERNNSSLVYMVKSFIEQTNSPYSGFFLNDYKGLIESLKNAHKANPKQKILLIGVTFGLLDLAESGEDFSFLKDFDDVVIMETGGMKGRRKELLREEVHEILTAAFGVQSIHSEYGMTELLSQGYSYGEGIFELPASMRVLLRDVNDPFTLVDASVRSGGINVIDLANIDSCSFIETKDLGSFLPDNRRFRILGRFDNSDIRGCNLMTL